jgi:hypothetical protein
MLAYITKFGDYCPAINPSIVTNERREGRCKKNW